MCLKTKKCASCLEIYILSRFPFIFFILYHELVHKGFIKKFNLTISQNRQIYIYTNMNKHKRRLKKNTIELTDFFLLSMLKFIFLRLKKSGQSYCLFKHKRIYILWKFSRDQGFFTSPDYIVIRRRTLSVTEQGQYNCQLRKMALKVNLWTADNVTDIGALSNHSSK